MLFTTYSGWHQNFADLANIVPLRTKADFKSYLARLEAYPKLNDAALAVTAEAVRGGYVLPCSVLGNQEQRSPASLPTIRFGPASTSPSPASNPPRSPRRTGRRCRRARGS